MKILLPVILPILNLAVGNRNLVLNTKVVKPLLDKRNAFHRIFFRVNVNMNNAFCSVLFEKLLFNQINVSNLHCFLLKSRIILDINTVRHGHICNITCNVDILRCNRYGNFCPAVLLDCVCHSHNIPRRYESLRVRQVALTSL